MGHHCHEGIKTWRWELAVWNSLSPGAPAGWQGTRGWKNCCVECGCAVRYRGREGKRSKGLARITVSVPGLSASWRLEADRRCWDPILGFGAQQFDSRALDKLSVQSFRAAGTVDTERFRNWALPLEAVVRQIFALMPNTFAEIFHYQDEFSNIWTFWSHL